MGVYETADDSIFSVAQVCCALGYQGKRVIGAEHNIKSASLISTYLIAYDDGPTDAAQDDYRDMLS